MEVIQYIEEFNQSINGDMESKFILFLDLLESFTEPL